MEHLYYITGGRTCKRTISKMWCTHFCL